MNEHTHSCGYTPGILISIAGCRAEQGFLIFYMARLIKNFAGLEEYLISIKHFFLNFVPQYNSMYDAESK